MANEQNLRPHAFTSDQSREEAAKNGRKGGVASGAARRRKKAMRAALNEMLAERAPSKEAEKLEALGVREEDADWQAVILAAMLRKAAAGSVQAFDALVRLSGNDAEIAQKKADLRERKREFDEDIALRRQIAEDRRREASTGASTEWIEAVVGSAYERDTKGDDGAGADNG